MKKTLLICSAITLSIYAIIMCYLFFNNKTIDTNYIQDLTNYNISYVKEEYKDYKLSIIYIESNEDKDTVLYTVPSANKLVYKGQEIQVYVSNGISINYYKNLIGKYYDDCLEYLEELSNKNIEVIIENQVSNEYPNGIIVSQSSLDKINENEPFKIKINYNEPLIEIPDLINKTESDAKEYFKDTKIDVIFIYNQTNNQKGLIYYQSINPKSLVLNTNTKLYLYIAI